jgi:hemoglobin
LAIELDHFERWLDLFSQTALDVLPSPAASQAIAKAKHMTESFKAGLFPWKTADGTPSRQRP